MKIRSILAASAVIVATGFGGVAIAQDLPFPVQARQGQMKMMGLNLGVLVGMARGEAEYDADRAQAAANNLVALSAIDQSFHWPEGTDNMSLVGTRALPEIWENLPDFQEKYMAFGAAADGSGRRGGRRAGPDARGLRAGRRGLQRLPRRLPGRAVT
jgi:cytochrome c556